MARTSYPPEAQKIENSHGTVARSVRTQLQVVNSAFVGGGSMGPGDRGANHTVSMSDSNPHNSNDYVYRWRQYCQLYETSWEARKIIRIPVEDALRKPWNVEGLDDKAKTNIENKLTSMRFHDVLKRSLMLERLLGGCLSFLGLSDSQDDPSKEYKPTQGEELHFINAIPISRIARLTWCTDPLSEHYMRPEAFAINGNEVHVSRCLVWDGEPLFDPYDYALTNFRSNLAGFGPSKLAPIWDDIIKAVGSRQAAYQLIQTNNALIMAVQELQDLSGTAPGQKNIQRLEEIARQLSVYRAAMVDGEKVNLSNLAANFGSVPELLMAFLQVLSAASDIPATRFLGQAPGGLNATGESDLENYYNMIDAYQRQRIEPNLRRVYDIIGYSMYEALWKDLRKDMKFVFPPLWNTKEGDQADVAGKRIENALKLYSERAISDEKFIEEINAQGALSVKLDKTDVDLMGEWRDEQSQEAFGLAAGGDPSNPVDAKAEIAKLKNMATLPFNADGYTIDYDKLCRDAGGDPSQFEMQQFKIGYRVEQEHNDVTNGDPVLTAKIVLAHLVEDAKYYSKLEKMENATRAGMVILTQDGRKIEDQRQYNRTNVNRIAKEWDAEVVRFDEHVASLKTAHGILFHVEPARYHRGQLVNRQPSAAQIAAGNYKKEHIVFRGLDISIENPVGSTRSGVDETGAAWEQVMTHAYGYIKGTTGADKDHLDVFIGDAECNNVVVIDQLNLKTGKFDEHKIMLGFPTQAHAMTAYLSNYDETGLDRIGTLNPVISIEEFKQWLSEGKTTKPYAQHIK